MEKKYVFKEYAPIYKVLFRNEKKHLRNFLKKEKIEHVGSTAVPGLGGKGIIDILVGVDEKYKKEKFKDKKFLNEKELLKKAGYDFRPNASSEERLFFRKTMNKQVYHLHLTIHDEIDWLKMAAFRDYFLENPDEIKEYEKIKQKAVKFANENGEKYRKYKRKYIDKLTKTALRQSAKLY